MGRCYPMVSDNNAAHIARKEQTMSKYRDTDEVLEQIRKKLGIKSLDYLLEAERQIVDAIQSAPSVDIVFCKECKYYEAKEDWCYWRDEAITADDFCSYGERSE